MNKIIVAVTAAFTLAATTFAMADSTQTHKGGLYVGGGLGYASTDNPKKIFKTKNLFSSYNAENQASTLGKFTGNAHVGYLFPVTPDFLLGAEIGYNYLPESKYTYTLVDAPTQLQQADGEIKLSQYSFDFLGVGKYYLSDKLNIFAKGGFSYITQKTEQSFSNQKYYIPKGYLQNISESKSKIQPKIGVGIGYNITPNLELTAEFDHTFGDKIKKIGTKQSLIAPMNGPNYFLTDPDKIASSNEVLVGMNYYFNI